MKNKFLHILMVLVVLQSSVAMSDFYQPHHSEAEHIETIINKTTLLDDELQSHHSHSTITDINHSCHHFCSFGYLNFIDFKNLIAQNYKLSKQLESNFKNKNYLSIILPKDLRPPIT